ncbi:hypothetical protein [Microcoleus sp. D2_18a_D3]
MAFSSVTVKISTDTYIAYKKRALDENITVWQLVNEALKQYLNK